MTEPDNVECGRLRGVRQPHVYAPAPIGDGKWSDRWQRCVWCGALRLTETADDRTATMATPVAPPVTDLQPSCCGDSSETRQVTYPRPTVTERHDDRTIEERFALMRSTYEAERVGLDQWYEGKKR